MTTTARPCPSLSPLPEVAVPVRSPHTSLILAETARRRRRERCWRRESRIRVTAWFALFDRRAFDSICTQATPETVFNGTMPLVYTLRLF